MTTIKLTEEENQNLDKLIFIDANQEWKFQKPFYYKSKCGYLEIYNKDEYQSEINKLKTK